MSNELKQCPFCGHPILITDVDARYTRIVTKAACSGCRMEFEYEQNFALSKTDRAAINEPFEAAWNRRANDG